MAISLVTNWSSCMRLEPVAKPLFAWSYNAASANGQRGLKKWREKPG